MIACHYIRIDKSLQKCVKSQVENNIESHIKQYSVDEYHRTKALTSRGIWTHEAKYIDEFLFPHAKTLELGTGTGRLAFGLESEKGFSDIVATDIVPSFIDEGASLGRTIGSHILFKVCNVLNLPFADRSFDQVLFLGVTISHLITKEERRRSIAECFRVLKPGGRLLVNSHNWRTSNREKKIIKPIIRLYRTINPSKKFEKQVLPRLGKGGKPNWTFFTNSNSQLYYYRQEELKKELENEGFNVAIIESQNLRQGCYGVSLKGNGDYIYAVGIKPEFKC